MTFLYNLLIRLYYFLILIVSLFNKKAKLWLSGRKDLFVKLRELSLKDEQRVWFHCASLGEFEQARPVIEQFREQNPEIKIVLTFFSPSGYEIRKNYQHVDYVFYLPLDTKHNAHRFVKMVKPQKVFFVKYEFWYHILHDLKKAGIETISFSTIFRPQQVFFKSYGGWYRSILSCFTYFFVQNEESHELLKSIGFTNIEVAGDTRFDRVYTIARQTKSFKEIEEFCNGKKIIIGGSTWQPDEELLIRFVKETQHDVKLIIAPHEIHQSNIKRIEQSFESGCVRFSQCQNSNLSDAKVLIIDNIGMLSSLYKYGNIAFIGGGFGVGIHNILEAATFGLPIVFGTNYKKFQEANDLIDRGAAFSVENYNKLLNIFGSFFENKMELSEKGKIAADYIDEKRGATNKICN